MPFGRQFEPCLTAGCGCKAALVVWPGMPIPEQSWFNNAAANTAFGTGERLMKISAVGPAGVCLGRGPGRIRVAPTAAARAAGAWLG